MTHREALDILSTLRLSPSDAESIRVRLTAVYQSKDAGKRRAIIDDARALEAERRTRMQDRFGDLLQRGRAAFLTDSAYVVAIAEEAAAATKRAEYRTEPEQQEADALKLFAQGAGIDEVQRITRMGKPRLFALLRDAPEKPQKPARRIERTDSTTPAPRPITVRHVAPTKVAPAEETELKPLFAPHKVYDDEPRVFTVPDHGTLRRYQNPHACRCEMCRAAKSVANRREREKRAAQRANAQSTD